MAMQRLGKVLERSNTDALLNFDVHLSLAGLGELAGQSKAHSRGPFSPIRSAGRQKKERS